MTLIGDPSYLKGDLTKLDRDKYNKRDSDFSGVVLYSTPKGKFVNAWTYKNGTITGHIFPDSALTGSTTSGKEQINTVKTNLIATTTCYTWTQTTSYDGQSTGTTVLETYCITSYSGTIDSGSGSGGGGSIPVAGTGGGGGGGGSTTPPSNPPCVPTAAVDNVGKISVNSITVNKVQPLPGDPGTGYPPPTGPPCSTTTTSALTINTDSLKKKFPCAVALIINNLASCGVYANLVQPFISNQRPDLIWKNGTLPWNAPIPNSTARTYQLAVTQPQTQGAGLSATVTLNTQMLTNSSRLLIAAAIIHETMHAYINYGLAIAQDNAVHGYTDFSNSNWLLSIDQWCSIDGLPSNFSNHSVMLTSYFDQAVNSLKSWDNGAHSDAEYAMAMMYGLNTSDPTATAAQTANLQQTYDAIKTKYSLTDAQMNAFYVSSLNSTDKLPGNCNN